MNQNKISRNFQSNFEYLKPLLKPEFKKYYDDLEALYIDRKIVNIRTITNLFDKLITTKSAKFVANKINQLSIQLPNYIEKPTTKQTKEERLKKYESEYINKGFVKDKDYLHKDNKIYKIKDRVLFK